MTDRLTRAERAWLAGLFEGEGTVGSYPLAYERKDGSHLRSPIAAIRMTDEEIVRKVHHLVGYGSVACEPKNNPKWNTTWRWIINGRHGVEHFLKTIEPWLGTRRIEQFNRAFAAHDASIQKPQFTPKKWIRTS
jgi:hypothetical protein